jgi:Protein of unknown function (DUF1451).
MNDEKDDNKLARTYEKMATRAREIFNDSSEKSLEALEKAIEASREHFVKLGEITQKESAHLKYYLRRDLEQSAKHFQELSEQAKKQFNKQNLENLQAGFLDLTASVAHGASDLFSKLADWAESGSSYHTGQITAPGILRCRKCEKEMHFRKTGNIPPCPSCHATDFIRTSSNPEG